MKYTLNRVGDFDPYENLEEMTYQDSNMPIIDRSTGETKKTLRIDALLTWFWKRYPNGAIVTEQISDSSESTSFRATIYADRRDETPIATGSSKKYRVEGEEFPAYDSAETLAVRSALRYAGFGPEIYSELSPKTAPSAPDASSVSSSGAVKVAEEFLGSLVKEEPQAGQKKAEAAETARAGKQAEKKAEEQEPAEEEKKAEAPEPQKKPSGKSAAKKAVKKNQKAEIEESLRDIGLAGWLPEKQETAAPEPEAEPEAEMQNEPSEDAGPETSPVLFRMTEEPSANKLRKLIGTPVADIPLQNLAFICSKPDIMDKLEEETRRAIEELISREEDDE